MPSIRRLTSNADIGHAMQKDLRYTILGVNRQTISEWETDETLPDIRQWQRLALLYGVSLDVLMEFDLDISEADIPDYAAGLWKRLIDLEKKYGYNDLDAFLVLKDILAWSGRTGKNSRNKFQLTNLREACYSKENI